MPRQYALRTASVLVDGIELIQPTWKNSLSFFSCREEMMSAVRGSLVNMYRADAYEQKIEDIASTRCFSDFNYLKVQIRRYLVYLILNEFEVSCSWEFFFEEQLPTHFREELETLCQNSNTSMSFSDIVVSSFEGECVYTLVKLRGGLESFQILSWAILFTRLFVCSDGKERTLFELFKESSRRETRSWFDPEDKDNLEELVKSCKARKQFYDESALIGFFFSDGPLSAQNFDAEQSFTGVPKNLPLIHPACVSVGLLTEEFANFK